MLRHKIGTLAGKIWQLMDSKRGDISIKELMGNNEAEIKKKWSCIWLWDGLHAKIKLHSR